MNREIKAQSTKKNFIFQILYQVVVLVIPLCVAPYLTRTLGDTALGIYSYTYSIAYYFVIFAMLGISKHGQRIIAAHKDNKEQLRKAFWSLYSVHAFFSIIVSIAFFLFLYFFGGEYKIIYLIQAIYVVSALFDITWLFYGLENFRSVVIRNLLIRIVECILIFCLVKSSADLWKYTLIMACSVLLGQMIMFPQAIMYIRPIKFGWVDVKEHFKPLIILFVAVLSATIYQVFDKTLLGIQSTKENVAYYEYSNKIINIPKSIISVIGTVMYPRVCASLAKGDIENSKKYIDYSLHFTCFLGVGSVFGLIGISNLFSILYYGKNFATCGSVIMALAPVIIINEIGGIVRTQYMVPNHMDFLYTICLAINAVLNLIVSIVLIPVLGIYGAILGTIVAELFGTIFQLIVCRKILPFKKIILTLIPYALFGLIMFGMIYLIQMFLNKTWLDLLLQIGVAGILYCLLCALYIFKFSTLKNDAKRIIKNVFKRGQKTNDDK